ncbi:MAG: hypothetical protein JO001_01710 [Alphaproteobacteria bacterium]|nr:hypothetical protein [Alphaproteobacteria bacterium]
MLLVTATTVIGAVDRERIDQMARDIVLDTYRLTETIDTDKEAAFDAALSAYQRNFPSVAKAVARRAVLFIIESELDATARN